MGIKWNIKNQILISMMIVGILSLAIITTITSIESKNALLNAKISQLVSIAEAKKEHISDYFNILKNLLISNSDTEQVKSALVNFDNAYGRLSLDNTLSTIDKDKLLINHYENSYINKINFDLPNIRAKQETKEYLPLSENGKIAQYMYIVDNQYPVGEKNKLIKQKNYENTYVYMHNRYHNSFNRLLNEFGLYDIFLINTNGDVVYTVFKEKDFATNLYRGVYKNSGLAKVYKKALTLKDGEFSFEDFAFYEPSYNLPASFIATPVFEDNQIIGVLAFQLPINKINDIMSFHNNYKNVGLGESGECYLVGSDYKMKNESRFLKDIDDKLIQKSGTTIGVLTVNTKSTQNALSGLSGSGIIKNYRNEDVISAYNNIDIYGSKWAIIAEIDKAELFAPINELLLEIIIIALIIIVAIIIVAIVVSNKISYPIKNTITNLNIIAKSLLNSATMITDSSMSMSDSANHQASTVEEISATVEESTANTEQNSQNANTASKLSKEVDDYAKNGYKEVLILQESMHNITTSSNQISNIIKTIDEIAFQTNLLSLNAAVEAARAGEHGLSFAVVAEEVRSLANRSATAAQETAQIISKSITSVNDGNKINDRVNKAFGDIVRKIEQNSQLIDQISVSSSELSEGMTQVNATLIDIDKATQIMASASEELASSAEELKENAEEMSRSIEDLARLV